MSKNPNKSKVKTSKFKSNNKPQTHSKQVVVNSRKKV